MARDPACAKSRGLERMGHSRHSLRAGGGLRVNAAASDSAVAPSAKNKCASQVSTLEAQPHTAHTGTLPFLPSFPSFLSFLPFLSFHPFLPSFPSFHSFPSFPSFPSFLHVSLKHSVHTQAQRERRDPTHTVVRTGLLSSVRVTSTLCSLASSPAVVASRCPPSPLRRLRPVHVGRFFLF